MTERGERLAQSLAWQVISRCFKFISLDSPYPDRKQLFYFHNDLSSHVDNDTKNQATLPIKQKGQAKCLALPRLYDRSTLQRFHPGKTERFLFQRGQFFFRHLVVGNGDPAEEYEG